MLRVEEGEVETCISNRELKLAQLVAVGAVVGVICASQIEN